MREKQCSFAEIARLIRLANMAFASYLVGWSGSSVFVDLTRSAALGVLSFSMFGSFIHVSWNPQQMSKTLYCFLELL